MLLDERAHNRQAHAESTLRAIDSPLTLLEEIEYPRQQFRGDALAVVPDLQDRLLAGGANRHLDLSVVRRVLERIVDEIGDDLLEPRFVRVRVDLVEVAADSSCCRPSGVLHRGDDSTGRCCNVQVRLCEHYLAARDAGDVEQLVDHGRQVANLPVDDFRALGEMLRGSLRFQERRRRRDGAQRVAQLVAKHRQEAVFRLVRVLGRRAGVRFARDGIAQCRLAFAQ